MKNKIIIISFAIIIVLVVGGSSIYFVKYGNPFNRENYFQGQGNTPGKSDSENKAGNQVAGGNSAEEFHKIATDEFSITLPVGWEKTINNAEGVLAMAANSNEQIKDTAVQKINFKSYLAISSENFSGKTMQEYMQTVKEELQKSISGIVFSNESDLMINGRPARALEMEMVQLGANFKVLMVAIRGEGDDVWVLSYNTAKSSWDDYRTSFSESAKSFALKK